MIFSLRFKKTICVSFLGHLALFGIFSFSFGYKINRIDSANISFLGSILRPYDLITKPAKFNSTLNESFFPVRKGEVLEVYKRPARAAVSYSNYLKPQISLELDEGKVMFKDEDTPLVLNIKNKKSVIMFYPVLPYHFSLYFKDRQVAHIELMFNIISREGRDAIVVKRKISSGNLEADLLSMRYINRYLFTQHKNFAREKWQSVEIDLSKKE